MSACICWTCFIIAPMSRPPGPPGIRLSPSARLLLGSGRRRSLLRVELGVEALDQLVLADARPPPPVAAAASARAPRLEHRVDGRSGEPTTARIAVGDELAVRPSSSALRLLNAESGGKAIVERRRRRRRPRPGGRSRRRPRASRPDPARIWSSDGRARARRRRLEASGGAGAPRPRRPGPARSVPARRRRRVGVRRRRARPRGAPTARRRPARAGQRLRSRGRRSPARRRPARGSGGAGFAASAAGCGGRPARAGCRPPAALEPLEPLVQGRARRVDLRPRRAQQRQLDRHPRVVALADRGQRRGELVDRADERDLAEAAGLVGEPRVLLGGDEEVVGDLAERARRRAAGAGGRRGRRRSGPDRGRRSRSRR